MHSPANPPRCCKRQSVDGIQGLFAAATDGQSSCAGLHLIGLAGVKSFPHLYVVMPLTEVVDRPHELSEEMGRNPVPALR